MKKIFSLLLCGIMILGLVGCKSDGLVRKIKEGETLESLNESLKGTQTIVEDEEGKFDELISSMQLEIKNYDNLAIEVNKIIELAENKQPIKCDDVTSLLISIEENQDNYSSKREGIYTYNEEFGNYWLALTDAYNYLKVAANNIDTISSNGTVEQARECFDKSKESIKLLSDIDIKEEIFKK